MVNAAGVAIGRRIRDRLEGRGMCLALAALADLSSVERTGDTASMLGYHAVFHMIRRIGVQRFQEIDQFLYDAVAVFHYFGIMKDGECSNGDRLRGARLTIDWFKVSTV